MAGCLNAPINWLIAFACYFIAGCQCLSIPSSSTFDVTNPPFFDSWCREKCSSWEACNIIFGQNFVDLRLRVKFSINDGPGEHLIFGKKLGPTISRQSFETQFVLDIATALETSPCRLYITNIFPEGTKKHWDTEQIFLTFRLFPADSNFVSILTKQIQETDAILYRGKVTHAIDRLYGLMVLQWDFSLKLLYEISIIGTNDVIESERGKYLNQGSLQTCATRNDFSSQYCIFERYLKDDLETSLGLEKGQFVVLFIKEADMHSVIVSFRLIPSIVMNAEEGYQDTEWINSTVSELLRQISDSNSPLYSGNVSFKVDSTWGVSGMSKQVRRFSNFLSRPAPSTPKDAYERCKATHRCPRGWSYYNQSSTQTSHTFQSFPDGEHTEIPLFLNFEDWRHGTRGWEQSCRRGIQNMCLPPSGSESKIEPFGAHWSPFAFDSLGPSVPTFGKLWNSGLVLNEDLKNVEIQDQIDYIKSFEDLEVELDEQFKYGVTDDATVRSRSEIREKIVNLTDAIAEEKEILQSLLTSQCSNIKCELIFNTSNALLMGAFNATGIITTTPDGTEVVLWAFDSISIDENVHVTVTGQRAMALASRSSVQINTSIIVSPGTLGGFPGGFSVSRRPGDRLVKVCTEGVESRNFLDICKGETPCCPGDLPIGELDEVVKSNNINGPGSPSTRIYLMTIQTSAPVLNEIVTLISSADSGQTLSGGFQLHFNGYKTPLLPYDVSASDLKRKMEDSLNPVKKNQLDNFERSHSMAGIGVVDVSREYFNNGYRWSVTFSSAVGNIGQDSSRLAVTNLLISRGARVSLETVKNGNTIGGYFALRFLGHETRQISHDVSATQLEDILLNDIPPLKTVKVLRNDPTSNCNDGFCNNGPGRSGGYTWTLTLTTDVGNVTPFSPTSSKFDQEGVVETMTALNYLTGCIKSTCPTIHIDRGHSKSHNQETQSIFSTKPFSLAYGGVGAGYGGDGGNGFEKALGRGKMYGDENITNLYGGSGGGVGVKEPFQLGIFPSPRFRGGSGGGAIEIIASNDITLGSKAFISCGGESGANGYWASGGGGSGGTILIAAGGSVQIFGKLSVDGGAGGPMKTRTQMENISNGGNGGGGSGGRMAIFGQSIMVENQSFLSALGGKCSAESSVDILLHDCNGDNGTIVFESGLDTEVSIDRRIGAAGTRRSLYLRPRSLRPSQNPRKIFSTVRSGPEYDLKILRQPHRISFYLRLGDVSKSEWDATFEVRDARWSYLSSKPDTDYTTLIGLVFGKDIRHQVNYFAVPFDDAHVKKMKTIQILDKREKWIKVDIRFNWKNSLHAIYVNDVLVVSNSPFNGHGVRALSFSNYNGGSSVWFDEIFVGEDTSMGFHCPVSLPTGDVQVDRPPERGWDADDVGDRSSLRPMQRHESHVSRRSIYTESDNYVAPFDGQGHKQFTSDVKIRTQYGDKRQVEGKFYSGSLLQIPAELFPSDESFNPIFSRTANKYGKVSDVFVWYGEHDQNDDLRKLSGAVMACSTQDFVTWRNEGAMLHYSNLTDMVKNVNGPFHVEKPKVLYNNVTRKYVMWTIIDNVSRQLGLAGVAVSDYPNGPFHFIRSFYPDGNQTHDQTLFQDENGAAYLIRTYYSTVEYILPRAMMQPTWESVKHNTEGSNNGIHFALSFHRAEYEPGYDDYHDIYLQRWRAEDIPWKIICINRVTETEREVPFGKEYLNFDAEICQDPFEYKRVLGLGNPLYKNSKKGIQSRFLDPVAPSNNAWIPESVPGAKGQTWKENYEASCGRRMFDNDIEPFDPFLPFREQPNRGNCSGIVDNPTHATQADIREGTDDVVERRRAKFVAISLLTEDYLDTAGILTSFEGEMDEGTDLLSIISKVNGENKPFQWNLGQNDGISTTFQSQIHDDHFSQKIDIRHSNIRSSIFSPACVYDGIC